MSHPNTPPNNLQFHSAPRYFDPRTTINGTHYTIT